MRERISFIIGALLLLGVSAISPAHSAESLFVSFDQFLQETEAARFESFALDKAANVRDLEEFGRMRQHILSLYQGVEVAHSFVLGEQIFDCVPIAQQPSVRQLGLKELVLAPPAALTEPDGAADAGIEKASSPLEQGLQDAFGNTVSCDDGTIPLRRITLEETTRFKTLEGFFRKTPWSEGGPLEGPEPKAKVIHKYAHGYQSVKSYGGSSWLNLWNPVVNTPVSQVFSLSQQWYVGGRGKSTQTVEGGWQVYPAKYRTTKAVTFIYWTADNYKKTGCYNLDCAGFVQVNSKWPLGGIWGAYSTPGGQQWEFLMQWRLFEGRWWLFLQGDGASEAVGYYPASIFRGGQLTRFAERIDYGGETVGETSWPQMGSGASASAGFRLAAYQRRIFYLNTANRSIWAALRVAQTSPRCYNLAYTTSGQGGDWGTYFFFGGPGGKC